MATEMFTSGASSGLRLDPRTKLFMLIMVCFVILGGGRYDGFLWIPVVFMALPLVMMLSSKRWGYAMVYACFFCCLLCAGVFPAAVYDRGFAFSDHVLRLYLRQNHSELHDGSVFDVNDDFQRIYGGHGEDAHPDGCYYPAVGHVQIFSHHPGGESKHR